MYVANIVSKQDGKQTYYFEATSRGLADAKELVNTRIINEFVTSANVSDNRGNLLYSAEKPKTKPIIAMVPKMAPEERSNLADYLAVFKK